MTGTEFAELVEWVQDRWGRHDEVWANASRFVEDFHHLDAADVWAALHAKATGSWAPRPPELVTGAREQARTRHDPTRQTALPRATGGQTFSEWCQETYGEVLEMGDLIRRRHAEMDGMFVEDTEARLPGETSQVEDGVRPKVQCRSPICDIHAPPGEEAS